jgi:hypothetical protein
MRLVILFLFLVADDLRMTPVDVSTTHGMKLTFIFNANRLYHSWCRFRSSLFRISRFLWRFDLSQSEFSRWEGHVGCITAFEGNVIRRPSRSCGTVGFVGGFEDDLGTGGRGGFGVL